MNWTPAFFRLIVSSTFVCVISTALLAENQPSGGMIRHPDVSAEHIVFVYANDIWIVDREGGTARPLASPQGRERMPRFSPDGKSIAFTGNYEGGTDVYVIPVTGGNSKRLTYHPAGEMVCDWLPNGNDILYSTNGFAGLGRQSQLFTISEESPLPKMMPVPYGSNGAVSDDGKWLAYTPHSRDTRTWKRYRGGMASDIWLFNLKDKSSEQITDFEGTDSLPMWHGAAVYYLSDGGEEARLNIWKYDTKTEKRSQITKFKRFDCKFPSIGPGANGEGEIVFSNGPDLKLLNLDSGKAATVEVSIPGDRPRLRPRRVDASRYISAGDVSPKAKRVCVEARGDIWTLPAKKGSARNLTRTSGVAERSPSWSPDGRWIAYFSDKTSEYELYVTQSDGRGETKQLTKDGSCFRYDPIWSPDSKHIVFTDKTGAIYLHTIEGETKLVDTDPYSDQATVNWAKDSNWLTYSIAADDKSATNVVWIYNVKEAKRHQVTSGFFNSSSPVFDREGDFLYMTSARAFSEPEYEDLGTTFIYSGTEVVLAVPLRSDVEMPMLPESDEEEWEEEEEDDSKDKDKEKDKGESKDDDEDSSDDDEESEDDAADDESDDEDKGKDKDDESEGEDKGKDKDDEDDKDKDKDEEDGKKKDEEGDGGNDDNLEEEDAQKEDSSEEKKDADESQNAVSGTWVAEINMEQLPPDKRSFVLRLELAEDGSVTGEAESPDGDEEEITEGTFDKDSGELSLSIETDEGTATIEATITDGEMKGTMGFGGLELPFTATRNDDDDEDSGKKKKKSKKEKPVEIEFDGMASRMFQLPVSKGNFGQLAVNHKNQLIYARIGDSASIKLFDMHDDDPTEKTVASGAGQFAITADGKKLLVFRGDTGYIINASAGQKLDERVPTRGMRVMIDPREEWKQVFTDAWRIERDFFYDPNMHGVDWKAVHDRYAAMIEDCTSREDLGFLIGEMIGELNVGHAYYRSGPETERGPRGSNVGLLGCTLEAEEGHYRIGTIYEGAEWDTDARNPLRAVGAKEGQFILEVNGTELTDEDSPYAVFEGLAGSVTALTISDDATVDEDDKRIHIKPLSSDANLRFRHSIEKNRKYVEEKSAGRVGYIYVVNTGVPGQNDLVRQYYGQLAKEALIIDDRWNGGGQIPTRFIELLNRPVTNYWAKRDGRDWTWPPDAHHGPKCMLTNGMAGSGGDMFPALFKQAKIGKLIGMRTWGGLVGISGNPSMIDGSGVTAPTFAYYEKDGTWGIEGHGVDPDMKVIDDPAKMVDGGDPQLDAAIEQMLTEIKSNAYKKPDRPKHPDRSKFGLDPDDK